MMQTFDNEEQAYLRWISSNLSGYVINSPKQPGNFPDMLHKASCRHISTEERANYTTTELKKLCSLDKEELVSWAVEHSTDFRQCKVCRP